MLLQTGGGRGENCGWLLTWPSPHGPIYISSYQRRHRDRSLFAAGKNGRVPPRCPPPLPFQSTASTFFKNFPAACCLPSSTHLRAPSLSSLLSLRKRMLLPVFGWGVPPRPRSHLAASARLFAEYSLSPRVLRFFSCFRREKVDKNRVVAIVTGRRRC